MKTIELNDEQDWFIMLDDENEKTKYVFSDEVYSKLESVLIFDTNGSEIDFPLIEGPLLKAPNLKILGFIGKGCNKCIQSLNENGISAPILESISFDSTGITQIPEFLLKINTLSKLSFRNEEISTIPIELFDLINLNELHFQYTSEIRIIPDEIKNLVNLVNFDLWGANLEYLSPELFQLPKIR